MTTSYKVFVIKKLFLLSFVITILASILISVPSFYLNKQVEENRESLVLLEKRYRTLLSDVRFLMNQYAIFKKYGDEFYNLEARGLVGEVKRPRWVDNILLFSYAYQFKNMTAVLLPEIPIKKGYIGKVAINARIFYINPIRFTASLPSDIDYFRFLDFIRKDISNFYYVNSCSFFDTRIGDLYNVQKNMVGLFSYSSGKDLQRPISIRCVLNVITSKLNRKEREDEL